MNQILSYKFFINILENIYIYFQNFFFFSKIFWIYIYIYFIYKLLFFIKYLKFLNLEKIFLFKKKKIKKYEFKINSFIKNTIKKKKRKNYSLIIRLKKKNLFLTFLDKNRNVLIKNNIGSFGFKDKVKFTGYALQNTMSKFCQRILIILKKKLSFFLRKFWSKLMFLKKKYVKILRKWKIYFFNFKRISIYFKYIQNVIKKNMFYNVIKYRKYNLFNLYNIKIFETRLLENYLFINLILKNNTKYWAFRYILKGFFKIRLAFNSIKDKRAINHSKGFRLKKARRV